MMRNRKVWGVLGLLLALTLTIGYGQPGLQQPPLPPEFMARIIDAGKCPCYPNPLSGCSPVPGVFPAKAGTYTIWWYEDPSVPMHLRHNVSRKHSLAWYHDPSAWAFTLKEVGAAPDDPKGHPHTGMLNFTLPAWAIQQDGKGVLAFVMHDRRPGLGGAAVYYSDDPDPPTFTDHARVWKILMLDGPEGVYLICWEDWRDKDFNDQIDVLQIPWP